MSLRTQGTTQSMLAQGATEYLFLLAVVLIVALVSVALLGFFPGMASDAQLQENRIYWQSASPIAVIETAAEHYAPNPAYSHIYLRIRNVGNYPVRITKLLSANNETIRYIYVSNVLKNMSEYYYLAPGEESYFGWAGKFSVPADREISITQATGSVEHVIGNVAAICTAIGPTGGTVKINEFGFEYMAYIENQQITKREIGSKPLLIKCR